VRDGDQMDTAMGMGIEIIINTVSNLHHTGSTASD
jgi:hypothetical protein